MTIDLSGSWTCEIPGFRGPVRLPGTLDESGVGSPDSPDSQWKVEEVRRIGFYRDGDPIVTRLTRRHTFEGAAVLSRAVEWDLPEGRRVFLEVERARKLRLLVNGTDVPPCRPGSLSAPWRFEVTGLVAGRDEITVISDNSYPGWPRNAIVYASAASDETQTNWNGLLGYIRFRTEAPVFLSGVRVYPRGPVLDVEAELDAAVPWQGELTVTSPILASPAALPVNAGPGKHTLSLSGLAVRPEAPRWDLEEGNLHPLSVSAPGLETRTVHFGLRDFAAVSGRLSLNGRKVFLRGEANCAVFPETGYCPMDTASWKTILLRYRSYGANTLRFHSHCPPEAAFTAADDLGMLMQPELSHWDPDHAFVSEEARQYYRDELFSILETLANHPSFVMLTFGNELQADDAGHAFMDGLLQEARRCDPTRLYANGSNVHYGALGPDPASDFYTATGNKDLDMRATFDGLRGWLNGEYAGTRHDYAPAVRALREKTDQPVFSFEVGQYEVLPDFGEIDSYRGVTLPENLKHIRRKVREKGLEQVWPRLVEASGESALLCYRAEVEAALGTEGYSGISLLGLQDFPGQGTALVGMMNAHLEPKPYAFAAPERFAAFFRDTLPLALLDRFTYTAGETLAASVRMANYGKKDLSGKAEWSLAGESLRLCGTLPEASVPAGALGNLGEIRVPLGAADRPQRLTLALEFAGSRNEYPLWVYPDTASSCPGGVYECRSLDEEALGRLRSGGRVFLAPDSTPEALPRSVQAHFSPDFWSVCTFPHQAGTMGQWIDAAHPIFDNFPTESWNNWQWWPMANQRAMLLPGPAQCVIAEMDSYAFLRPMAKLFECRCEGGRLLVSSLGLHNLRQYPEARALLQAIYSYLDSDRFQPRQELSLSWIRSLF